MGGKNKTTARKKKKLDAIPKGFNNDNKRRRGRIFSLPPRRRRRLQQRPPLYVTRARARTNAVLPAVAARGSVGIAQTRPCCPGAAGGGIGAYDGHRVARTTRAQNMRVLYYFPPSARCVSIPFARSCRRVLSLSLVLFFYFFQSRLTTTRRREIDSIIFIRVIEKNQHRVVCERFSLLYINFECNTICVLSRQY